MMRMPWQTIPILVAVKKQSMIFTCCTLLSCFALFTGLIPLTFLSGSSHYPLLSAQAQSKKKKKLKVNPKLEEDLKEPEAQLATLRAKVQARGLFSHKDIQALNALETTFATLMANYPREPRLMRPVFLLGQLMEGREAWFEAYEAYSFVERNYPDSGLGVLASKKLEQLHKAHPDLIPAPEMPDAVKTDDSKQLETKDSKIPTSKTPTQG